MGGSQTSGQTGIYGTQGTAASSNIPGARTAGIHWTDSAGNFWLFGGYGFAGGTSGELNDEWKLSGGEWTWMGGFDLVGPQSGIYGTQGTAAPGNLPGSRFNATGSTDSSGNLWLFGGYGWATGAIGSLNDLWEWSGGEWTWVSGSEAVDQPGSYGVEGTAASGNLPPSRYDAVSCVDPSGNFWLFGGVPQNGLTQSIQLNDLWKYSPSSGEWTWMSGSESGNQNGVYGTLGTAASGNVPGTRANSVAWCDSTGNLWLFGGYGYDSAANPGDLNDLWKYSPTSGQWTWVGGSETINSSGIFGTEGTAASGNIPSARQGATVWKDASGDLWLFGGLGLDSTGASGSLNDLWKFSGGAWTWVSGSKLVNQPGVYGTEGTAATENAPGARFIAIPWTDASGNLWLFGGNGAEAAGNFTGLNDLWEYKP